MSDELSVECYIADKIVDFLDEVASPGSDGGSTEARRSQPKRQLKKPGRSRKLVLHIYGMSGGQIDSAIRDIESLCKDASKKRLLKSTAIQDFVSKMTQEQVTCYGCFAFVDSGECFYVFPITNISSIF